MQPSGSRDRSAGGVPVESGQTIAGLSPRRFPDNHYFPLLVLVNRRWGTGVTPRLGLQQHAYSQNVTAVFFSSGTLRIMTSLASPPD